MKVVPLPTFNWADNEVFLYLVAVAKEVVCWTRLKGMRAETVLCGKYLTELFSFSLRKKVKVEREVMSSRVKVVKTEWYYSQW